MSLQTIYVLKTCNCTVELYKTVGIINIPFLLLYFGECSASLKVTTIDVIAQNSCQEVAIFTVLNYIIPIAKTLKLDIKCTRILGQAKSSCLSSRTAHDQYKLHTSLTHMDVYTKYRNFIQARIIAIRQL